MTADHITAEQKAASPFFSGFWDNGGWGFGTSWYSDPKEDMGAILMTQRVWDSPSAPPVYLDFWTSACQTIDD